MATTKTKTPRKKRKVPANKQLAKHFKDGRVKKKFICSILEIEPPTLRQRMKDNKFKEWQLDKLESEGLFVRDPNKQ